MPSWQHYRTQTRQFSTRYVEGPVARLLGKTGITPNQVTFAGLLASMATAHFLANGQFIVGGALLLFAGALDMADGALARLRGKATPAGALLDSTVDRLAEAVVYLGLVMFYIDPLSAPEVVLLFLTLAGSFMVSYLRARGEGLGVDCKVGIMTRPERVMVLAAGLLLGQVVGALGIIAALSVVTVVQRYVHIQREITRG